jgi:phosphate uptake regulator
MIRHFDELLQGLKSHLMKMSALAEVMIADAVKSVVERDEHAIQPVYEREELVNRNVDLAREVLLRDDQLDSLKEKMAEVMTVYMTQDPPSVPRALDLLLISRYLERIGDHATNIAEVTIFVVDGLDIRHHADQKRLVRRP